MFTKEKMRLMAVFAMIVIACLTAKGFEVAKEGQAQCVIVLSPMAEPSALLAAEELMAYVKKISGAELPVRTELPGKRADHQPLVRHESEYVWVVNADKPYTCSWEKTPESGARSNAVTNRAIVIGTLESLSPIPAAVRKRLEECDNEEAFYIRSDGGNIFVIGKKPIGALYATYALLEDYLGVRWFYPGELGEYCPRAKTLILPEIDDFQKPDVAIRYQRGGNGPYDAYEVNIWAARHKMHINGTSGLRWFAAGACTKERAEFLNRALNACGDGRGGHMIWAQAVPDELFKTHPEYFPLKDGQRKFGGGAGGYQRCLSNPDVFKLVAEYALNWCNADPNNRFTFDASDSRNTWCDCEECRKMGTVDGEFKITNLYHRFAMRAVNYVLERNPNARIDVLFYIDKGIAPDDKTILYKGKNVRGVYCTCWPHARCYAHCLTDQNCEPNKKCLADLIDVQKICPQLYTFEYLCNANVEYVPNWKTTAQDVKDLAAIGGVGYMDIVHGYKWRARWPSLYLGAKLQWNAKLDPEKVMQEAWSKYYGPTAPVMNKYDALRLKLWENAPGHVFYGGPKRNAYCLTVPGAEKELREYLAEAKKMVGDDKVIAKRIALEEEFLDQFWKEPATELTKRFSSEKQIIPERVRGAIVIDGDLTEETWLSARTVTGFLKMDANHQPPSQDNSFRVAYDNDNLYIGFVAMNNKAWGPEIAKMQKRDGKEIWSDDHIELQLAPPSEDGRFYHIGINVRGMLYDAMMIGQSSDLDYDSQAEIKVKKLDDRFVYEIRLPLAPMKGDVAPGKVWGIYALRSANNLQPPENKESSSLDGNYPHRVMEFRQVVFGNNVVKNGNFSDVDEKKKAKKE